MASLSNSRCQNRKERQTRFTNKGDMAEIEKHYVFCKWVSEGGKKWRSEGVSEGTEISKFKDIKFTKKVMFY